MARIRALLDQEVVGSAICFSMVGTLRSKVIQNDKKENKDGQKNDWDLCFSVMNLKTKRQVNLYVWGNAPELTQTQPGASLYIEGYVNTDAQLRSLVLVARRIVVILDDLRKNISERSALPFPYIPSLFSSDAVMDLMLEKLTIRKMFKEGKKNLFHVERQEVANATT